MELDNSPSAQLKRQEEVLGCEPGYCRAFNSARTFICELPEGHDGNHQGFEMPTVDIDESEW